MTFELPKTQDALTRPEKWNNDWETLLKTGFTTPKVCLGDMLHTWRNGIDEVYHSYSILYTSTCEVQWRVGKRAMIYLDELEPAWNASTKDERRKHLLIGMSTACSKARNLNDARSYCPDEIRLTVYTLVETSIPTATLTTFGNNPLWGRSLNPYNKVYICGGSPLHMSWLFPGHRHRYWQKYEDLTSLLGLPMERATEP